MSRTSDSFMDGLVERAKLMNGPGPKDRTERAEWVAQKLADLILTTSTPAWLEAEVSYLMSRLGDK